ncbi:MAG: hypothetical protein US50_C0001G0037 [Candidatus Nomurabacteria bacterium GW2011_GWB1_37_5]|uniref:Uncharacterized protein n=1 Tax=Candidatus Nomurabacteria bacterium GW2011_GWB1_37_5 TaxID=1618742 RepID=A0A0G0HBU6_9BACT|nr:MAG: hypothetical protein US50_C0001G0037 [Candidatus Nomurabacteria bacterium GW2011_GWB1_37_5]
MTKNSTKHPRHVEGYSGSLEDLAKAIGNMAYDQTSEFIGRLAGDIKSQAEKDLARGRTKLASKLNEAAFKLQQAQNSMHSAWKICEPFMKEE